MAGPSPNRLRFADCELPEEVFSIFTKFLDEFDVKLAAYDLQLEDLNNNDVPLMLALIQEQVDLREELLSGAPVPELSSLDAVEKSIKLTSPGRPDDAESIRQDERKLGAAGIVCVNGKIFAKALGNDIEPMRALWLSVGGEYEAFIALGDGIAAANPGDFTVVQYNPKSTLFPSINTSFDKLNVQIPYHKLSSYKQAIIWTDKLTPTTPNYLKLKQVGFSDESIRKVIGRKPLQDSTTQLSLQNSLAFVKSLSRLLLLPIDHPERQPFFVNEAQTFAQAAQYYLSYRIQNGLSSHVFKTEYWELVKAYLQPLDMKELFEQRPEIKNVLLPTDDATLGQVLTAATSVPIGTSVINSYMIQLPDPNIDQTYEDALVALGAKLLVQLKAVNHSQVQFVTSFVEELKSGLVTDQDALVPVDAFNINDMKNILDAKEVKGAIQAQNQLDQDLKQTDAQILDGVAKSAALVAVPAVVSLVGATAPVVAGITPLVAGMIAGTAVITAGAVAGTVGITAGLVAGTAVVTAGVAVAAAPLIAGLAAGTAIVTAGAVAGTAVITAGLVSGTAVITTGLIAGTAVITAGAVAGTAVVTAGVIAGTAPLIAGLVAGTAVITAGAVAGTAIITAGAVTGTVIITAGATAAAAPLVAGLVAGTAVVTAGVVAGTVGLIGATLPIALTVAVSIDPLLSLTAMFAASAGGKALAKKGGQKVTQGLQTLENFASILLRRVNWKNTYTTCQKTEKKSVQKAQDNSQTFKQAADANHNPRVVKGQSNSLKASDRKKITPAAPVQRNKVDVQYTYQCFPKWDFEIGGVLAKLAGKLKSEFFALLKALKVMIIRVQDAIDTVIIKLQLIMDVVLAKLERLLTFDFHFGLKLGFDNSLLHCSWDLDLGLKIDLFGIILKFLNKFLKNIFGPLRKGLKAFQDMITQFICIPIRLLEALLGAINALLGLLGCSLKDIRLPAEILDFLKALLFSFDLRSLVLRKGYDAIFDAYIKFGKHPDNFRGLSDFAALCQSVTMRDALNGLEEGIVRAAITAPTTATNALKSSSDFLTQKAVSASIGI